MYLLSLFYPLLTVFALATAHVTNPALKKIYEECQDECGIKVRKIDWAHWIPCVPNCMEVKLKSALKSQNDSKNIFEKILAWVDGTYIRKSRLE